jgi:acetyl-CoA synthetase
VITSSGYRIGPGEIEDCLLKHPAVALAAAVGKPDALRTEIVKAFVVLKPGVAPGEALPPTSSGTCARASRRMNIRARSNS